MAETFITLYQGNGGRVDIGYDYTQNIATNKTTLTVKAYVVKTNSSYYSYRQSAQTFTLTVNGVATTYGWTFDFRNMTLNQRYLITTATREIAHNADGTRENVTASVYCATGTDGLGTVNGSTSAIAIATIPRTSTPTLSTSSQAIGSAITINTNRASTSFTHTITYTFGNASGTIATGIGDSYAWTLPASLANQIPNTTTGTGSIKLVTYSGSTKIGEKSISFTATVPNTADFQPTATGLTVSIAGSGRDKTIGKYIQGISKATMSFTATAKGGATITSNSINVKRQSDNANSMTVNGTSGTSGTLTLSGTYIVTATTTDSRGRSKTTTTTFSVNAYAVPKITNFTATRQNTTKTSVDTVRSGTYSYLGGDNPLSVVIAKRPRGGSYTNINASEGLTNGTFSGTYVSKYIKDVDTDNSETISYDFKLTIRDSFGNSAVAEITVPTSSVALSINGDIGIGVGKIHEQGALDVAGNVLFNNISQQYFGSNKAVGNGNELSFWYGLESGTYFVQPGEMTGQPSDYGFLQVAKAYGKGSKSDFTAFWFTQSSGSIYRKSGNGSTMTGWVKIPMNGDSYITLSGAPIYYGIEQIGGNANGRFVKFGDGTLICWYIPTISNYSVNAEWGTWYVGAQQTWTFPHAFVGEAIVTAGGSPSSGNVLVLVISSSTVGATHYAVRPVSGAVITYRPSLMAIGRWK